MKRKMAIKTTLGDLVAMLTEEVARFARTERERNAIVAHILSDLLSSKAAVTSYRLRAL